eukprot:UN21320
MRSPSRSPSPVRKPNPFQLKKAPTTSAALQVIHFKGCPEFGAFAVAMKNVGGAPEPEDVGIGRKTSEALTFHGRLNYKAVVDYFVQASQSPRRSIQVFEMTT